MASDKLARNFTLSWDGGYLNATQGLLEFIYGKGFMDKAGAGTAQTISVKEYQRTRVIGGTSKRIAPHTYSLIKYPRRVSGGAMGGQPIQIEADGSLWTARLGGSVQDFKAYLAGAGKPANAFQFWTEKGSLYSSAS